MARNLVINEKNTLTFVSKIGLLIYLGFIVIATATYLLRDDINILTGTIFGGGLSLVNFDLLKRIGRKIVEDPKKLKVHYFAFIWLKFVVLIAICFMTVYYELVNIPSFFIGLSVIVLAVIAATIYAVYHGFTDVVDEEMRSGEEKFIGWDDVDKPYKKDYKAGSKKSAFDRR